MKAAGLLLLLAGWAIVLTAIVLLPGGAARVAFVFAGIGIEALGMVLVTRAHIPEVDTRAEERR